MGQYIPTKVENRKVITCFLKDTVSGRLGDGDSTSEKKQHNLRETPKRQAEPWRKNGLLP